MRPWRVSPLDHEIKEKKIVYCLGSFVTDFHWRRVVRAVGFGNAAIIDRYLGGTAPDFNSCGCLAPGRHPQAAHHLPSVGLYQNGNFRRGASAVLDRR